MKTRESNTVSKGEATRAHLAESLERSLMEGGSDRITIRQVTDGAGVDRQTFYYHFENMDELLEYLCRMRVPALSTNAENLDVSGLLGEIVGQVARSRDVLRLILERWGRDSIRSVLHDDALALLKGRMEAELAGLDVPKRKREFAAEYCVLASASVIEGWIRGNVRLSAKDLSEFLVAAFYQQLEGTKALCLKSGKR